MILPEAYGDWLTLIAKPEMPSIGTYFLILSWPWVQRAMYYKRRRWLRGYYSVAIALFFLESVVNIFVLGKNLGIVYEWIRPCILLLVFYGLTDLISKQLNNHDR